jgi:hypothetical protein
VLDLLRGEFERLGHVNRVYAAKFVDESLVLSGGWDNTILFFEKNMSASCGISGQETLSAPSTGHIYAASHSAWQVTLF